MDFDHLMASIATLPPAKLKEAKARLALLSSTTDAPADNSNAQIVYSELSQAISRSTGVSPAPYAAIARTRYGASLREGAETIVRFAETHLKPKGRAGMIQAVRILVGLIVRQVQREAKVRLAAGPICLQLKRVGEIVEQAFPGYIACGLLPMILNRRRN